MNDAQGKDTSNNGNDKRKPSSAVVEAAAASEEASLLASIGSKLANTLTYETQVINDEKLKHTPILTGIGFPDLSSLAPSHVAAAAKVEKNDKKAAVAKNSIDLPHVLTTLSRVRSALQQQSQQSQQESRQTHKLQIQYQILLTYLAHYSNVTKEVAGVDIQAEKQLEAQRKVHLRLSSSGVKKKNKDTSSFGEEHEDGSNGSNSGRNRDSNNYTLHNRKRKRGMITTQYDDKSIASPYHHLYSEMMQQDDRTGPQRLQDIKHDDNDGNDDAICNGYTDVIPITEVYSKSKTASFGKQALEAHDQTRQQRSQQQERRRQDIIAKRLICIEKDDPEGGENVMDIALVRKKRMERMEKRRQNILKRGGGRRGRLGKMGEMIVPTRSDSDHDKKKSGKTAIRRSNRNKGKKLSPRTTTKMKKGPEVEKADECSVEKEDGQHENDSNLTATPLPTAAMTPSTSPPNAQTISCSICQKQIHVPDGTNITTDEYLARHMQSCEEISQNDSNTGPGTAVAGQAKYGAGGVRSSVRLQRRSVRKVCYAENDDSEEDVEEKKDAEDKEMVVVGTDEQQTEKLSIGKEKMDETDDFAGDLETSSDDDEKIEDDFVETDELDEQTFEREQAIDDYEEYNYEDRVDEWIESGISSMRKMSEQDTHEQKPGAVLFPGGLEIPAWVNDRLFGYQRTGLRWMWELHMQSCGGIVGDEMGLGKTVQICSYLGSLAANRKLRSVLIISPATILNHWLSELAIWAPGLRRVLIHSSAEKSGETSNHNVSKSLLNKFENWLTKSRALRINEPIDEHDLKENDPDSFCGTGYAFVTTYENIRRNADIWVNHRWSYIIMDEGQKIRNPDAEATVACKRLRTPHRLLLSGTPIQNDLRELWSLFDFVFPGRLGTLPVFENEFALPIKQGGYANASPMQVQLAYRCSLVLRDLINPFLLRRQKKDVKEVSRMPGKTEQVLFCKLSERQRSMYKAYLQSDEVKRITIGNNRNEWFGPIIKLRKICNHPDLVCGTSQGAMESFLENGYVGDKDSANHPSDDDAWNSDVDDESLVERSGKLEVLSKILPLWKKQGHRVLIFSQWKLTLNIIQHFVSLQGWKFGRMDGDTNVSSRQKMVDTFNSDTSYFGMLMTTKTGGVGLNLTGANRVILFDPDWNPQTDAQARERAWRFGQQNAVTVYRLITAGTIEEKIYHRQIFKTTLTNQILHDPKQRRMFSKKDLRDLFTLKEDQENKSNDRNSNGAHSSGTETEALTKRRGKVGTVEIQNNVDEDNSAPNDNNATIEEVMKSKGLAGVFDHDFVEQTNPSKSQAVRDREDRAKKAAMRAARWLEQSCEDEPTNIGRPTWTGSDETEPRRFGGVKGKGTLKTHNNMKLPTHDSSFGGAASAGIANSFKRDGSLSSGSLLQQLRGRRDTCASSHIQEPRGGGTDEMNKDDALINRLCDFIKRFHEGPSTDQIFEEFKDIRENDGSNFRKCLKRVAILREGKWMLI